MNKKFELTNNTKKVNGTTLYQIRSLQNIDCYNVKIGDLGGWVQSENNLTHFGTSWIDNQASVFNNAIIRGNALVAGNAHVYGDAVVAEYASVLDNAQVYGNPYICGDAWIHKNAIVCGNSWIDNAVFTRINGYVNIAEDAYITSKNDYFSSMILKKNTMYNGFMYRTFDNRIKVIFNFYYGELNDFINYIIDYGKKDKRKNKRTEKFIEIIERAKIHFEL